MGLDLNYINGQTPLDEDEKEGIVVDTITNRTELDEFEQLNIEKAVQWTFKRKFKIDTILTEKFIKELHRRMFDDVWQWAGEFRQTNKNLGADKFQIGIELKNLIDDCNYWINNKTFDEDEMAVRFSHRLVKIHLFSNGIGRHSRLVGDILINHGFGKQIFTWGKTNLNKKSEIRNEYLTSLREADEGDYKRLLKFARS